MEIIVNAVLHHVIRLGTIILVTFSVKYIIKKILRVRIDFGFAVLISLFFSLIISYIYKTKKMPLEQIIWEGFAYGIISAALYNKVIFRLDKLLDKLFTIRGKKR